MKILVSCEYSGIVRDSFIRIGHDAISCDLLPSDRPGPHYQGNVLDIINDGFDLMIAHPPCTMLCNSSVRWLVNNQNRYKEMLKACDFFNALKNCNIPRICIENPIPHKYAKNLIGEYTQIIQPWMFGHPETKATCLWLKNLPKLVETNNVKQEMLALPKKDRNRIHYMSPSKDRWKLRSTTFSGIGEAMANQWGNY
jgi:hypothetical protein